MASLTPTQLNALGGTSLGRSAPRRSQIDHHASSGADQHAVDLMQTSDVAALTNAA
ncbi:MAG: hypothetical protein IPK39_14030 [Sulfuritalea sp.]|nr:hypothetical protein [Sulfuritalea sp.]